MKFVVTHKYDNTVDVSLHWETKDKIKKFLGQSAFGSVVVTAVYLNRDALLNIVKK